MAIIAIGRKSKAELKKVEEKRKQGMADDRLTHEWIIQASSHKVLHMAGMAR